MKRGFVRRLRGEGDEHGFTLIEILMVILLIAVLAAVGITAFINFTTDAKNAATKSNLQIIRNGIGAQFANLTLHCGDSNGTWPIVATLNGNDITKTNVGVFLAGTCTLVNIPVVNNRQFVGQAVALPVNPWGLVPVSTVFDCTLAGGTGGNPGPAAGACLQSANIDCNTGAAYAVATADGWCYDPTTGNFWANSRNNGLLPATGNENTF